MTKLLTKEQLQEKLENKRKKLLEQRTKRIAEEIELILSKLTKEQHEEFFANAKSIAESKKYSEDSKLEILDNIANRSNENHYGEIVDKNEGFNSFADIKDDIVYQRMVEEGDMENIKLFLERKLPFETYCKYLFIDGKDGKEGKQNNEEGVNDGSETLKKDEKKDINSTPESEDNQVEGKDEEVELQNLLIELSKYGKLKKDLVKKIRRVKKEGVYKKSDFDKYGTFGDDFYGVLEKYGISEYGVKKSKVKRNQKVVKPVDNGGAEKGEKVELTQETLKSFLENNFTSENLFEKYESTIKYNEQYYNFSVALPKNISELITFFEVNNKEELIDKIFGKMNTSEDVEENDSVVDGKESINKVTETAGYEIDIILDKIMSVVKYLESQEVLEYTDKNLNKKLFLNSVRLKTGLIGISSDELEKYILIEDFDFKEPGNYKIAYKILGKKNKIYEVCITIKKTATEEDKKNYKELCKKIFKLAFREQSDREREIYMELENMKMSGQLTQDCYQEKIQRLTDEAKLLSQQSYNELEKRREEADYSGLKIKKEYFEKYYIGIK